MRLLLLLLLVSEPRMMMTLMRRYQYLLASLKLNNCAIDVEMLVVDTAEHVESEVPFEIASNIIMS
jgi:hypothetical protein